MRAFSFRVERGTPVSWERLIRRPVRGRLFAATLLSIRSWLSFRVLRRSLRRSSTPPVDIGGGSLSSPVGIVLAAFKSVLGRGRCPYGVLHTITEKIYFWARVEAASFITSSGFISRLRLFGRQQVF